MQVAERFKPAVRLLESGERLAVLKDYSGSGHLFGSILGRFLVRHEAAILKRLEGMRGVPRLLGFHGRLGLVTEYVDGKPINTFKGSADREGAARAIERLGQLLGELHGRGIAHVDVRQRKNVLLTERYEPYLVDFASAVYLGDGLGALVLRVLSWVDRSGMVKMKERYFPFLLTDLDRKFLSRQRVARSFWIFRRASRRRL